MTIFGQAAAEIAAELTTAPHARDGRWSGDTLVVRDGSADGVRHDDAGHDLYGGSAGIAWFLAHQARRSGASDGANAARAGLRSALAAGTDMVEAQSLSLYGGAAGIALAVHEGARALDDHVLSWDADQLARKVAFAASKSVIAEIDLIGGKAGILIALLAFAHARQASAGILRGAIRILAGDLAAQGGDAWWGGQWTDPQGQRLCGLGHGASGIAWALQEAGDYLGDDRMRDMARAALRYEATQFDPMRGSWPDLRATAATGETGWMDAWCHGAFGIGAVRWWMWDRLREPKFLAQASAAIAAARMRIIEAAKAPAGQRIDVTLCHGLGGAAELMLLAYEITGRAEHLDAARRVGRLILRLRDEAGGRWAVGLPGGRDVPGLFLGRAGIGTLMLRLDHPEAIPSPMLAGLSSWRRRLKTVSHPVTFDIAHVR